MSGADRRDAILACHALAAAAHARQRAYYLALAARHEQRAREASRKEDRP